MRRARPSLALMLAAAALLPASALAGGARRLQVEALPPAGAFSDRWLIRARSTDAPPIALPITQPGR